MAQHRQAAAVAEQRSHERQNFRDCPDLATAATTCSQTQTDPSVDRSGVVQRTLSDQRGLTRLMDPHSPAAAIARLAPSMQSEQSWPDSQHPHTANHADFPRDRAVSDGRFLVRASYCRPAERSGAVYANKPWCLHELLEAARTKRGCSSPTRCSCPAMPSS